MCTFEQGGRYLDSIHRGKGLKNRPLVLSHQSILGFPFPFPSCFQWFPHAWDN